jgi:hypothetical protein
VRRLFFTLKQRRSASSNRPSNKQANDRDRGHVLYRADFAAAEAAADPRRVHLRYPQRITVNPQRQEILRGRLDIDGGHAIYILTTPRL